MHAPHLSLGSTEGEEKRCNHVILKSQRTMPYSFLKALVQSQSQTVERHLDKVEIIKTQSWHPFLVNMMTQLQSMGKKRMKRMNSV
jgi:hypothetical protein